MYIQNTLVASFSSADIYKTTCYPKNPAIHSRRFWHSRCHTRQDEALPCPVEDLTFWHRHEWWWKSHWKNKAFYILKRFIVYSETQPPNHPRMKATYWWAKGNKVVMCFRINLKPPRKWILTLNMGGLNSGRLYCRTIYFFHDTLSPSGIYVYYISMTGKINS